MIVLLDDEAELALRPTQGIHQAAGSLAAAGAECRVVDLFCALTAIQLELVCRGAALIVVHSNGNRIPQLQASLATLRQVAPPGAQILLVGWLDELLAQVPLPTWLAWVAGVYASGAHESLASFLEGVRQGTLSLAGERKLWGFDVPGVPLPTVACLQDGYSWRVRPLVWEKLVCDSVCQKCTYGACPVKDYALPHEVVARVQPVRHAVECLARTGATYIALEDNLTNGSLQKLGVLADVAATHPELRWVIRMDATRVLAQPEILSALGRLPLAGVTWVMPAMTSAARAELGLPQAPDDAQLLRALRDAVGHRVFVYATGYVGYPSDAPETAQRALAWAERMFDAELLDHFRLSQAFFDKRAPIARNGGYRFPYPGRYAAFKLPYWESDYWTSEQVAAAVLRINLAWCSRSPLYADHVSLDALLSVVELGAELANLRQVLRGPLAAQWAVRDQLMARRSMFAQQYLEACKCPS